MAKKLTYAAWFKELERHVNAEGLQKRIPTKFNTLIRGLHEANIQPFLAIDIVIQALQAHELCKK